VSWCVVVNPWSGRTNEVESRARRALLAAAVEHRIHVSRTAGDVAEVVAAERRRGATNFAAVGGDGTAHLVLNAILAEPWPAPPTLAILPAGSGSDFIRTFGLPRTVEAMAPRLATPDRYRCDVGVIEGGFGRRYFLNVADAGVAAASVRMSNRLPRFVGGARYAAGFWLTLARFPAAGIRIEAAGRTYEGPAINVVVANGQFFGGGMNVAPRATLVDGLLDVQVFVGPRRHAFSVMPRVVRGLHLSHRGVRRFSAPEFTLECPAGWPIEADGELLGRGPVRGEVLRGGIEFKI
jgi:YegS/Rv2252/BmrU family lipid kinase